MGSDDVAFQDEQLSRSFAQSLDAERAVVGGMLVSPDSVWDVQRILRPGDFADGRCATIAGVIVRLAQGGGVVDAITVSDALERQGLMTQAGGAAFLFECSSWVTGANVTWHAEIVRDAAIRRSIREAAAGIAQLVEDGDQDAHAITERARALLDAATNRTARNVAPIGEDLNAFLDGIGKRSERYPSPWPSLDEVIGGFAPGRLYVIAARPGTGKTIMGVQIAAALADHGLVAYSSLEMERAEILSRLFASQGSIPLQAVNGGAEPQGWAWDRIAGLRSRMANLPLYVDDSSEAYMADVLAHARTVSRRGRLTGVVVDYLGLLSIPSDRRSRWEHFTEISHQLKRMAKALHVPVIALQQLGRGMEDSKGVRPPTLADIRDSGAIEQDADVVMLLHMSTTEPKNAPQVLLVNVAKNRHGPAKEVRLGWRGGEARLTQIAQPTLPLDEDAPPEAP